MPFVLIETNTFYQLPYYNRLITVKMDYNLTLINNTASIMSYASFSVLDLSYDRASCLIFPKIELRAPPSLRGGVLLSVHRGAKLYPTCA